MTGAANRWSQRAHRKGLPAPGDAGGPFVSRIEGSTTLTASLCCAAGSWRIARSTTEHWGSLEVTSR